MHNAYQAEYIDSPKHTGDIGHTVGVTTIHIDTPRTQRLLVAIRIEPSILHELTCPRSYCRYCPGYKEVRKERVYASRLSATQLTALLLSFCTWSLSAGATTARVWLVYLSSKRLNGRAWRIMKLFTMLSAFQRVGSDWESWLCFTCCTLSTAACSLLFQSNTPTGTAVRHKLTSVQQLEPHACMNMCDMHVERHYF